MGCLVYGPSRRILAWAEFERNQRLIAENGTRVPWRPDQSAAARLCWPVFCDVDIVLGGCILPQETSPSPTFGISIYTPEYYMHIFWSIWRVLQAFFWATVLGVPLGLFMGWKRTFRDYTFPVLEIVRPIPVLAWVPVAILIFAGIASREAPVIFLAFLATFFATVLNTMLGVESIDEVYFRAARCLGSKPHHIFFRVVLPGALPFIFTGLQIGVGVGWFSLVAAEMISGEYGLGFLIWDSYVLSQFPVIIIAMLTLGVVGYVFSAIIRIIGASLMRWADRSAR